MDFFRGMLNVSATSAECPQQHRRENRALMRKRIWNTAWCGLYAVLLSTLFVSPETQAATVTVHVGPGGSMTFSPGEISIAVGDTVEWVWESNFHSVTSGTGGIPSGDFDSDIQTVPFTFSHTFLAAGNFPYFCIVRGTMTGTVHVFGTSTVSLAPSKDNTLYEDATGQTSNGQGIYLFAGKTNQPALRRGLVAFDLAAIPTNATITDASLSLFLSQTNGTDPTAVSVSKVSRDWGEGASDAGDPGGFGVQAETDDATWLHTFYDTSFWMTAGGDFSLAPSATTMVSTANTTYMWSGNGLLADVQGWVSNPATNFGWVIRANEIDAGTAKRFNTGENDSNPPQLTVTYQFLSGTPTPTPSPSVLGNISTRLRVETGENVLIGGFIVTGTQSKRVIVRAIGPSLPFPGSLADPTLELRDSGGALIRANDNWRSDQESEIIATTIPPSNDLESAIVAILPANSSAYTAIVRGVNDGTGIGVVEAYDLNRAVNSKLANISTRGLVQTGENVLIGGLIVLGQSPLRIIVRAIGPSLPVAGALADPMLELRDVNGGLIDSNDNWRSDHELEIIATTIPPSNDLESAIVRNLAPGTYTAIVSGVGDTTGVGVVEAYNLN